MRAFDVDGLCSQLSVSPTACWLQKDCLISASAAAAIHNYLLSCMRQQCCSVAALPHPAYLLQSAPASTRAMHGFCIVLKYRHSCKQRRERCDAALAVCFRSAQAEQHAQEVAPLGLGSAFQCQPSLVPWQQYASNQVCPLLGNIRAMASAAVRQADSRGRQLRPLQHVPRDGPRQYGPEVFLSHCAQHFLVCCAAGHRLRPLVC